ncbi:hypothetical protein V1507DRAFT_500256 [Lipomyces tetrasporus]
MSSQVKSSGIFYGLPEYASGQEKQSVLVAGANGITGAHVTKVLNEHPERWSNVYALSRKPPSQPLGGNVTYLSIDLLNSPEQIAKGLEKTGPMYSDYVLFAAYIQTPPKEGGGLWSDTAEMGATLLLSNLLEALKISKKIPKRFVLQTGGKHYGVHIGPTLNPMEESDPRYLKEENFYFPQEDLLWKWAEETGATWNVTRPGFIIGAVPEAAMSIALALALYATIQKELDQPLEFHGDGTAWAIEKQVTSSRLTYRAEWLFQTPTTANEILNIADGGSFSYGKFWPILAAAFGVRYEVPKEEDAAYQTITMPQTLPPRGFGPAGSFRISGSFDAWSQRPEVLAKWAELKAKYGLEHRNDPFENHGDVFGLLDGETLGNWGRSISMNKNRKLGWHGFVDSADSFLATFEELVDLKMIPPFKTPEKLEVKYTGC